jgi:membrane protease subunit (stomatin/prohibitin family)
VGILDKLRAELVDIVEWVDDSRHTLVWRFPRWHNQIKHGAKLIVRPGQEAIFVREGQVADVFGPGTHTLVTKNLPVLSTLAGWPHGFDSPFKAEVYFVATRQVTDLKWGTPNPVPMRDADFGPVRVRAFGTFTLRATDPAKLLRELVGTDSSFESDEVGELLRAIIAASFADVLAAAEIAVLDLASNYRTLSESVRQAVVAKVRDEFGLDVPQLWIVNISLPAEVEQALDARTSMNVVGDLASYQQYRLGQAMSVAAANPAGGLAGAGVGLGMGLVMANRVDSAPPPVPAVWHVVEGGRTVGPWTAAQIEQAAASGRLGPDTLVWTTGMAGWSPASRVPQLAALVPPPPPPAQG